MAFLLCKNYLKINSDAFNQNKKSYFYSHLYVLVRILMYSQVKKKINAK